MCVCASECVNGRGPALPRTDTGEGEGYMFLDRATHRASERGDVWLGVRRADAGEIGEENMEEVGEDISEIGGEPSCACARRVSLTHT